MKRLTIVEILTIASIIIIVILLVTRDSDWTASPTRRVLTLGNIRKIEAVIRVFFHEHGHWPDESQWKDQIKPYLYDPNAHAETRDYMIDGWGNQIAYRLRESPEGAQPFLYSFGPNGKDELGEGDDMASEIKAPKLPNDE